MDTVDCVLILLFAIIPIPLETLLTCVAFTEETCVELTEMTEDDVQGEGDDVDDEKGGSSKGEGRGGRGRGGGGRGRVGGKGKTREIGCVKGRDVKNFQGIFCDEEDFDEAPDVEYDSDEDLGCPQWYLFDCKFNGLTPLTFETLEEHNRMNKSNTSLIPIVSNSSFLAHVNP